MGPDTRKRSIAGSAKKTSGPKKCHPLCVLQRCLPNVPIARYQSNFLTIYWTAKPFSGDLILSSKVRGSRFALRTTESQFSILSYNAA